MYRLFYERQLKLAPAFQISFNPFQADMTVLDVERLGRLDEQLRMSRSARDGVGSPEDGCLPS